MSENKGKITLSMSDRTRENIQRLTPLIDSRSMSETVRQAVSIALVILERAPDGCIGIPDGKGGYTNIQLIV